MPIDGIRPKDGRTLTKEITTFPIGNLNLIDAPGFDGQEGIWGAEQIKQLLDGNFTSGSFIQNANEDKPFWVIKEDGKPIKPDGVIILLDYNDERADVLGSVIELMKQLNNRTSANKIPFVVGLTHLQEDDEREKHIKEKFELLGFETPEFVLLRFKKGSNDNTIFDYDIVVPYLTLLQRILKLVDNAQRNANSGCDTCSTVFIFIKLLYTYIVFFYNWVAGLIQPLVVQMESIPTWAIIIITLLVVFIFQRLITRPPRIQNPPNGEN